LPPALIRFLQPMLLVRRSGLRFGKEVRFAGLEAARVGVAPILAVPGRCDVPRKQPFASFPCSGPLLGVAGIGSPRVEASAGMRAGEGRSPGLQPRWRLDLAERR